MLAIGAVGSTLWTMHGTTASNKSRIKSLQGGVEEVQKGIGDLKEDVSVIRKRHNQLATEVGRIQGQLNSDRQSGEGSSESGESDENHPVQMDSFRIPKREIPDPSLNTSIPDDVDLDPKENPSLKK